MPQQLSFWSIPAMMPSITGLRTRETETARGAAQPVKPVLNMPQQLFFWKIPVNMSKNKRNTAEAHRNQHNQPRAARCQPCVSKRTENRQPGSPRTRRAREEHGKEEVRGRRFFLLFFLFRFPPFFCMTSHLVATQLTVAFSWAESCPRRSARPRNSPTSLISCCSLLATFASSFSTSFASKACERRKETEVSSLGRPTCPAARQPQTEVPAAPPVEAASVPVGRRPAREPPPPCPPASLPLLPRPDQHCGDGQRRGLRRRSTVRGATTNAGVALAASWRHHWRVQHKSHPLGFETSRSHKQGNACLSQTPGGVCGGYLGEGEEKGDTFHSLCRSRFHGKRIVCGTARSGVWVPKCDICILCCLRTDVNNEQQSDGRFTPLCGAACAKKRCTNGCEPLVWWSRHSQSDEYEHSTSSGGMPRPLHHGPGRVGLSLPACAVCWWPLREEGDGDNKEYLRCSGVRLDRQLGIALPVRNTCTVIWNVPHEDG